MPKEFTLDDYDEFVSKSLYLIREDARGRFVEAYNEIREEIVGKTTTPIEALIRIQKSNPDLNSFLAASVLQSLGYRRTLDGRDWVVYEEYKELMEKRYREERGDS